MSVNPKASTSQVLKYRRPRLAQYQLDAIFCAERYSIIEASTKAGKAQPLDAALYTPQGKVQMKDAYVGMEILTPNGMSFISGIYPQGLNDIYKVTFYDGSTTECTLDHLWEIHVNKKDYRRKFNQRLAANPELKRRKDFQANVRVLSLEQILNFSSKRLRPLSVTSIKEAQFNFQAVPLDAYLIGVLIGDGSLNQGRIQFSTSDDEILEQVKSKLPDHHIIIYKGRYDYQITLTKHYNLIHTTMHKRTIIANRVRPKNRGRISKNLIKRQFKKSFQKIIKITALKT